MKIQTNQYQNTSSIALIERNELQKKDKENAQAYIDKNQAVEVSISEEGIAALREYLEKSGLTIKTDDVKVYSNTNEIMFEHYMEMKEIEGQILKNIGGKYDVKDVMKATMTAYATQYNKIIKEHEEGNRQVTYDMSGKRSLTLEEDLKGLDEAFERLTAELEGFITCQQVNKSAYYYYMREVRGKRLDEEKAYVDGSYNFFDEHYNKSAVSMLQQAREEFLELFKTGKYKKDAEIGIITRIIGNNTEFLRKTEKLYSEM